MGSQPERRPPGATSRLDRVRPPPGSYDCAPTGWIEPATMIEPTENDPAVRAFVERLAPAPPKLSSGIHEADEMYSYNLALLRGCKAAASMLYYLKGWQIAEAIRAIASMYFDGLRNVESFLDFASGFGRVTRFLVRELDPARICVAEIQRAAVEFQCAHFGVEGLVSASDALGFDPPRRFRFVMATSFFSHVPDASFRAWMRRLLECVEPGGVLAFSTNDIARLGPPGEASGGLCFIPESETDRLDKTAYGTTYVSEGYVREIIGATGDEAWAISRLPRGLGGLQDLYLVSTAAGPDPRSGEVPYYAWGDTDLYEIRGGRLAAAGWVETVEVAPPVERVEFFVNDDPTELCALRPIGSHRLRWSFDTSLARIGPDDVLSVRAMAGTRLENFLALASLRTHPASQRVVTPLATTPA